MNIDSLYDEIARRKSKNADLRPYVDGNGRVDRCRKLVQIGWLPSSNDGWHLDVGGGTGQLTDVIGERFERSIVLDISSQQLQIASAKGHLIVEQNVDVEGLPRGTEDGFALITALDFIEHIIDPENFAREAFRVLRSDGAVYVNTPNILFWRHVQHLLTARRFPHTSGDREVVHGGHTAFFTYLDLVDIFTAAGFVECDRLDVASAVTLFGHDLDIVDPAPAGISARLGFTNTLGDVTDLSMSNIFFRARR